MAVTFKKMTYVEHNITCLIASMNVRYWEDGELNGENDVDAEMPCKKGDVWALFIDVNTGQITNWDVGNTAKVHYKVCDAGTYILVSDTGHEVISMDGYVPSCLCPNGGGYGDYVIMEIDENGYIKDWKPNFEDFEEYHENNF